MSVTKVNGIVNGKAAKASKKPSVNAPIPADFAHTDTDDIQPPPVPTVAVEVEEPDHIALTHGLAAGLQIQICAGDSTRYTTQAGVAQIIQRDIPLALSESGELAYYKNGKYNLDGETCLGHVLWDIREKIPLTYRFLRETICLVKHGVSRRLGPPDAKWINLRNGLYNVETGRLDKPSPDYLSTIQLPFDCNTEDSFPVDTRTMQFFQEILEDDSGWFPYEVAAWLLSPGLVDRRALFLLGNGRNGKSIFIHWLQSFLGRENCCSLTLHELGDRFGPVNLLGKLANLSGETSKRDLTMTGNFKALTGGDAIKMEVKHGRSFMHTPFCKHVFAMNAIPVSDDDSDAFLDRVTIIRFPKSFRNDPAKRAKLEKMLADPQELSYCFEMVLAHIGDVRRRGLRETKSMLREKKVYRSQIDSVLWFAMNYLVYKPETKRRGVKAYLQNLYDKYAEVCGDRKDLAATRQEFSKRLRRHRPEWDYRRTMDGYTFLGVRLVPPKEE